MSFSNMCNIVHVKRTISGNFFIFFEWTKSGNFFIKKLQSIIKKLYI